MDWLRLWHDMPHDPKWRTIARQSKQPISLVQALYLHLLVDASKNVTRGNADVTVEDLASALDVDDEQIEAIIEAMQGRVLEGRWITGWEKRQPKRQDDSKDRVRRHREKKAAESKGSESVENPEAIEENPVSNAGNDDVTQCNAPEKIRGDTDTDKNTGRSSDDSDSLGGMVASLPCKDKSEYEIDPDYLAEITKLHPKVDVATELGAMRSWLLSNPGKRKTRQGMKRFINSWLSRAGQTPSRAAGNIHRISEYQQPRIRRQKIFPGHTPALLEGEWIEDGYLCREIKP